MALPHRVHFSREAYLENELHQPLRRRERLSLHYLQQSHLGKAWLHCHQWSICHVKHDHIERNKSNQDGKVDQIPWVGSSHFRSVSHIWCTFPKVSVRKSCTLDTEALVICIVKFIGAALRSLALLGSIWRKEALNASKKCQVTPFWRLWHILTLIS